MNKKKQKVHKKHQTHRGSRNQKKVATTSSSWSASVRAELGGGDADEPLENSSATVRGAFTPGEIGQVAPLDQEGEGNRQNDEAAELEMIEPDEDTKKR